MRRLDNAFESVLTVARVSDELDVKYPAAALAYYAFISLVPLLVLVFAVVSDRLITFVRATTPVFLTPDAQQIMSESLTTASGRTGAALLAIGVLAWSWSNIVIGFQTVIERAEQLSEQSHVDQLHDASRILGSFGLVIVTIILTNVGFALLPNTWVAIYAAPVVQWMALTVAFVPLYYAPSRVVTSLSGALPGALTAGFGWTVLLTAIPFFTVNATRYALYGVLSGIIIILTSFYVAAIILMIGIVVNTVVADDWETSRSSLV